MRHVKRCVGHILTLPRTLPEARVSESSSLENLKNQKNFENLKKVMDSTFPPSVTSTQASFGEIPVEGNIFAFKQFQLLKSREDSLRLVDFAHTLPGWPPVLPEGFSPEQFHYGFGEAEK